MAGLLGLGMLEGERRGGMNTRGGSKRSSFHSTVRSCAARRSRIRILALALTHVVDLWRLLPHRVRRSCGWLVSPWSVKGESKGQEALCRPPFSIHSQQMLGLACSNPFTMSNVEFWVNGDVIFLS